MSKIANLKETLLNGKKDPNLFQELRNVVMHTNTYDEDTRQELIELAKKRPSLFTSKQYKQILNNFQQQLVLNSHSYSDDDFTPNEAPELIDDYDYEEYF